MSKRLKMLPAFFMLTAGAITSIITYMLHYEGKTAIKILLGVLLLFYVIGYLFQQMIAHFEKQNKEEERKRKEAEGMVVEKENTTGAKEETNLSDEPDTHEDTEDSEEDKF